MNRRLIGLLAFAILAAAVPLAVYISQKRQELRQRASGEQTSIYFSQDNCANSLAQLTGAVGQQTTLTLCLATGVNLVSGFDLTINLGTSAFTIQSVDEVAGAQRFNTPVFKNLDSQNGTVRFAKVHTVATDQISGTLPLGTVAFTPSARATGNITMPSATISSSIQEGGLSVSLPTLSYTVTDPSAGSCSSGRLQNGCFEQQLSNWDCGGGPDQNNGTCGVESSAFHGGATSARVTNNTGTGAGNWGRQLGQTFTLENSQSDNYCLSTYVKVNRSGYLHAMFQEIGSWRELGHLAPDLNDTTNWQFVQRAYQLDGSKSYQVVLRVKEPGEALFDDVSVVRGACQPPTPTVAPTETPIPTATPTLIPTTTPIPTPTPVACPTTPPCPDGQLAQITPSPSVPQSCGPQYMCVPHPTPTPIPGGTTITVTLNLQGIGQGGNSNPIHPQRPFALTLVDTNDTVVKEATGTIAYNNQTGAFSGTVDLGQVAPGAYIVKAKAPRYLRKNFPGILTITSGTNSYTIAATPTLIAGDINGDNNLNIADYNILVSCFGSKANTPECGANKENADLTDDGVINLADYRLLFQGLLSRGGD